VTTRPLLVAALLDLVAGPAHAQFTATVAPPKKEKPAAQVIAEQQAAARADTARRTQLSEMRAWVDSAAQAATGRPVVRQDTTITVAGDTVVTPAATGIVVMPATATPLPILALTGLLLVGAGAAMVRQPARARSRRKGAGDA